MTTKYCAHCGTVAKPKTVTRGSLSTAVVLWLCFVAPGLIYSVWRWTTKYEACPACGQPHMLPLDSPKAAAALGPGFVPPAESGLVMPIRPRTVALAVVLAMIIAGLLGSLL